MVTRFGSDTDPELRVRVASALLLGGFALDELNRREEAIDAYNEVVARFGSDIDPELRELVAKALVYKGNDLTELSKQR